MIPAYRIVRLPEQDGATLGHLFATDELGLDLAHTCEKPWKDNHPDTSCIPTGVYTAHRRLASQTRHHYDVFQLDDVPGREDIQIHIANTPSQLEGCCCLGTEFGFINGEHGVLNSKVAYKRWMQINEGIDLISITIT